MGAAALLIVGAAHSRGARAAGLEAVQLELGTRYDLVFQPGKERNRLQGHLRLRFTLDTVLGVKLKGFTSTGDKFTSKYGTFYNFNDPDARPEFTIHFRQLYLERKFPWFAVQLGAVPPVKDRVSSTGLFSKGWIDGLRVNVPVPLGVVEVVAGSLTDLDNPNLFSRDHEANYLEAEVSLKPLTWLGVEASVEHLAGETYARAEMRCWLDPLPRRPLELAAEAVVNLENGAVDAGFTAAMDLLVWAGSPHRDRLELTLMQTYVDPDIGRRGELTEDFYKHGHLTTVILSGVILKEHGLKWFQESLLSDEPRLKVGLSVSYSL